MSSIVHMFNFSGRIGRGTFWVRSIPSWILLYGGIGLAADEVFSVVVAIGFGSAMVGGVLSLATQAKRWHDRGKSGAWICINFIPLIGVLWSLIETGFLPGDVDENDYGFPDDDQWDQARNS